MPLKSWALWVLAIGLGIVDDGSDPYCYYGSEPSMLRTVGDQSTLWEAMLPRPLVVSAELARADELLDDPRFFEPFRRTSTR